tara:strand:+ start:944 stop:2686 length:1743 start_codon:yes stop_codon:yes gene_type:complete
MRYFLLSIFFCYANASTARIMTYNLLNYNGDGDGRIDDYVTIIDAIQPDLIITQEIIGQSGFSSFKTDVLDIINSNIWSSGTFTNQSAQQDIALYYKHDIFTFLNTDVINTAQSSGTRDVIEWTMSHEASGIEFKVYGVHLKASSGSSNATERLQEATILRNHLDDLSSNSYFIVGGDFNIYSNNSSSEPAFQMLIGSTDDNDGRLFDPIDRIGHWHNNSSFADVHTQSPRTSNFGGGATGGMDDRFDWLFVSQALTSDVSEMYYVENTYWAFGNDGNHFNQAINNGSNDSVSDEIADALHDASDHLPVYMDVWFNDLTYSDDGIIITEIMVNPSRVSDSYGEWFEITNKTDSIININGWYIKDLGGEEHQFFSYDSNIFVMPDEYFVLARNGDSLYNGGFSSDYEYDGFSLSNGDDEIILLNGDGSIVDEVHYSESWAFSNGISMELHDVSIDNGIIESWHPSTAEYGLGDLGTPGYRYDGSLYMNHKSLHVERFSISSIYPNPFNSYITIRMHNTTEVSLSLDVYDLSGRIVETLINGIIHPGKNEITWSANGQPSGIYIFKFAYENKTKIRKAIFLK